MLKPKKDLRYTTKLDFFLSIAIQRMKNKSFDLEAFKGYPIIGGGFYTIGYQGISIDAFFRCIKSCRNRVFSYS